MGSGWQHFKHVLLFTQIKTMVTRVTFVLPPVIYHIQTTIFFTINVECINISFTAALSACMIDTMTQFKNGIQSRIYDKNHLAAQSVRGIDHEFQYPYSLPKLYNTNQQIPLHVHHYRRKTSHNELFAPSPMNFMKFLLLSRLFWINHNLQTGKKPRKLD